MLLPADGHLGPRERLTVLAYHRQLQRPGRGLGVRGLDGLQRHRQRDILPVHGQARGRASGLLVAGLLHCHRVGAVGQLGRHLAVRAGGRRCLGADPHRRARNGRAVGELRLHRHRVGLGLRLSPQRRQHDVGVHRIVKVVRYAV